MQPVGTDYGVKSFADRLRCFFCKPRPETEFEFDSDSLQIAPVVRASAHDDGVAILNIDTGKVFLSNRTGLQIWQGLASGLSTDAIAFEISREYDVACEVVRRHTQGFLLELQRRGLVVRKAEYRQ